MSAVPPSGTVTLLFTDMEGSTRLLERVGSDRYAELLADHHRLLRESVVAHAGYEVDTAGDAFFVAFASARDAVTAAAEAQRALAAHPWPAPLPLRVRMGLHTGEPVLSGDNYLGLDVHRAARVMAAGHGGQVVISEATQRLVAAQLPTGVSLLDLGEHRLKDLSGPQRLYQLLVEGLRSEFPPPRTLESRRSNLPIQPTPLVGRERELEELQALLASDNVRLLTLTGPGGTGKTRLALQLGAEALESFPDGVWFCNLAAITDPALVMPTLAQTLAISEEAGRPLAETLAEGLTEKDTLLLLDNFEQVVEAGREVTDLLARVPGAKVVVTSRARLQLSGEHEYPVPALADEEALALFAARAQAIKPAFSLDGNRPLVAEICRRLDNLPLAIELAAARIKVLPERALLQRLDERLKLLTGGARDLDERQRTLRAAIEWSYNLLSLEEQTLFRRLAVFSGGATLGAIEEICDPEGELDVLVTVASLVDKSLLRHDETEEGEPRFVMLETIREYAGERLEASGEADELRGRHAQRLLALARAAGLSLEPHGKQDLGLLANELDNVRAALTWWAKTDPTRALELASAVEMLWTVTDPAEGVRWFERLLAETTDAPLALRARALLAYATAAHATGDDVLPERLYRESLDASRRIGDDRGTAVLLFRLGLNAFYRGEYERAGELAEEALRLHEKLDDLAGQAEVLGLRGELEWARGDLDRGAELIERSVNLARQAQFPWWQARMLRKLVDCLLSLGRIDDADACARDSLRIMWDIGDRQMVVFTLARLARIASEREDDERAGVLWGAIEAEQGRTAMGAWAKERDRLGAPILARANPDFERGRERGRRLALDEAVAAAQEPVTA
jgi:predicted ATPase/class 3 adenylate cyclase